MEESIRPDLPYDMAKALADPATPSGYDYTLAGMLADPATAKGVPVNRTSRRDQDAQDISTATPSVAPPNDLRARLRAKDNFRANNLIYAGLASVLRSTGGMVWPYTPTITYNQDVTYSDMSPVHTNQEILAYTRTPATKLSVAGPFSSQTRQEALYNLACIHFLRIVTKMSFGSSVDPEPGTPPPVLLFEAHGAAMFRSLPVVVTSFNVTLPPDPDYIGVNIPGSGLTRVPVMFDITVNLTMQHSPKKLREWSLDKFRAGSYLTSGGWI